MKVLSEVDGPKTTTTTKDIITLDQYSYTSNTIVVKPLNSPVSETVVFKANNSNANSAVTSSLTTTSTYKPVYVYDYENEENESKREIKILKRQYIDSLTSELEAVLNV